MKILLGFILVGWSAGLEEVVVTTKIVESAELSVDAESTAIIKSILGSTEANMQTPDPVPLDILPELDSYHINTRIIIEGQPVQVLQDGQMIEGMWWSREPEDVRRDLDNAEKIFELIGVKFHISEISFREMNPSLLEHFIQANMHPNQMTIVYMLPNGFAWDGYSSPPWEMVNRGIVIHYLADEWTVAHEIGHYFGLLHPFDEDFVEDTPEQIEKFCAANCRNLMNYCNHMPKHVTRAQRDRFKRFLRAKRVNHYVREHTDVMLRGHEFPTPAGTKIIFNVNIKAVPE